VITAAQLYGPHQHKPTLDAERVLTVDLTTARAQTKGVTPILSHEGGGGQHPAFPRASQNVAVMAMLLDTLPPPSTDGVDMLYC
jgi:hypothetical protein